MNLINFLLKDIVKFAAEHDLDLVFIVKLIDYRLASIEVDITEEYEIDTYINNIRMVNTLFKLLGLATDLSDKERMAYDNDLLMQTMTDPARLLKYKDYKLSLIKDKFAEDVELFDKFIAEQE